MRRGDELSSTALALSHRREVTITAEGVDFRSSLYDMISLMVIHNDELLLMGSRSTLLLPLQHLEKRFANMKMQLMLPEKNTPTLSLSIMWTSLRFAAAS